MPIPSKPTLVLLHGFCENHTLWDHIIPFLEYDGSIVVPDLPGFGSAPPLNKDFTLEDIAVYLHNSLTKQNVQSCVCIGHSLGGYITLSLKRSFPEFVKKIGLVHSTAFEDTPEKKEGRNKLIKFLDNNPSSRFLSTFAYTLFCDTNQQRLKEDIEKVVRMSDGLSGNIIQGYAKAMRDRKDSIGILTHEKSPLFIAGECDNSVPAESSKKQISLIENPSHCYMLENVGHMGMYEKKEAIIEAIGRFIDE